MPWIARIPAKDRVQKFVDMAQAAGWAIDASQRLPHYIPHVATLYNLADIINLDVGNELNKTYSELFNITALGEYVHEWPARVSNVVVLLDWCHLYMNELKPGRGKVSHSLQNTIDDVQAMRHKIERSEKDMKRLLGDLLELAKDETRTITKGGHTYVKRSTPYRRTTSIRGRRYVWEAGAQSLGREVLQVTCSDTDDWDIATCAFVLLSQLVARLDVQTQAHTWEGRGEAEHAYDTVVSCKCA